MKLRRSCLAAVAVLGAVIVGDAAARVSFSAVRHVRVGQISIGYRRVGAGPPLVMITGFGATMAEWDPALIEGLAAHRTVIVFDNRGVSTSTDTSRNRLTIAEMADDTWRVIGRLGYRRADVLGWSMGSFIAQVLALRHPRVVRRLILSGADPGGPHAVQASARVNAILANPNTTPAELVPLLFPRDQQPAGFDYIHRVGAQSGLVVDSFTVSSQGTRSCFSTTASLHESPVRFCLLPSEARRQALRRARRASRRQVS